MKYRASELELRTVSKDEEIKFLNDNHYQGFIGSLICLGLYKDNELLELMSFGKPRYTRKFDWELLRLCTKKDYIVYGGASRLLKHFRENNPGSIISYCNESLFEGLVYKIMGFTKKGTCKSYHYEKDGKSYHRSNFQKWRLLKTFPQYDSSLTEKQIMELEGYTRVEEVQATWVLGDDSKYYIYEIENNGYHYIGQHVYRDDYKDDNYYGSGTIIKRLNKKYGNGNKTILIDSIKTREEANKFERCAIYFNKLVYGDKNVNILKGGQDAINSTYRPLSSASYGFAGKKHTTETKSKMSQSGKGKHNHKGANNPNYGKRASAELRKKLSEAHKLHPNKVWNKGINRTDLKDTAVVYRNIETQEINTRQGWKELGFDVYYSKKFIKLGRIRDLKAVLPQVSDLLLG